MGRIAYVLAGPDGPFVPDALPNDDDARSLGGADSPPVLEAPAEDNMNS